MEISRSAFVGYGGMNSVRAFQRIHAVAKLPLLSSSRLVLTHPKSRRSNLRPQVLVAREQNNSSRDVKVSAMASVSESKTQVVSETNSAQIRLLYDGECHLCMKEVNFLQRRDAGSGKIEFVDIAADDYDPSENADIEYADAMGRIHAIKADGSVITGVAVFRELYEAVGLGYIYAVTKNPFFGSLAEKAYNIWADRRLQLTGRGDLLDVIRAREERIAAKEEEGCEDTCMIEY
mmetsp:Transcript_5331/g.9341  ORF Transcript_5331/g.9341 Transcript_5331/m.9341 type:complete len:234 (-) Transcript_5331:67-768(-)